MDERNGWLTPHNRIAERFVFDREFVGCRFYSNCEKSASRLDGVTGSVWNTSRCAGVYRMSGDWSLT